MYELNGFKVTVRFLGICLSSIYELGTLVQFKFIKLLSLVLYECLVLSFIASPNSSVFAQNF